MTKKIDETMFDSFQIEGLWSPKKDKPVDKWNHGVLSYTPEKMTLKIFDSINSDGDGESFTSGLENFDRLFGFATTGECITLSGVINVDGSRNFPGIPTEKYNVSDFVISNERFDTNVRDYKLQSFKFSLTYMNVWLKNEMLSFQENHNTGTYTYVIDRPKRYDLAKFRFMDHNFTITMDEHGRINNHKREVRISNETRFNVEVLDDFISISEAIKVAEKFAQFFTVLFKRTVSIKYLNGKTMDGLLNNIICTQKYPINSDEDVIKQRLHPMYETVSPTLQAAITAWFQLNEEMQLLVQDYLLTMTRQSVIENSLINLTEGIESYYRESKGSLAQRLAKIIKEVPDEIFDRADLEKAIDGESEFTEKLKNTRVFLTHGTKRVKTYQKEELVMATKLLQDIVRYFILHYLGFSATELSSIRQDLEATMRLTFIDTSLHF